MTACQRSKAVERRRPTVDLRMASNNSARNIFKAILLLILIVMLLVATFALRIHEHVGDVLEWIQENRSQGAAAFVGLYTVFAGQDHDLSFIPITQALILRITAMQSVSCASCVPLHSSAPPCHCPGHGSWRHLWHVIWSAAGVLWKLAGCSRRVHSQQASLARLYSMLNLHWPLTFLTQCKEDHMGTSPY
jgi:hypothetical protein